MKDLLREAKVAAGCFTVIGAIALLAELGATLASSPPLRQIVTDLPFAKLLWQTVLLVGIYLLGSAASGFLTTLGFGLFLHKKIADPAKLTLWNTRLFTGVVLFLYASWAWRREIFPKTFTLLAAIIAGSLFFPLLL